MFFYPMKTYLFLILIYSFAALKINKKIFLFITLKVLDCVSKAEKTKFHKPTEMFYDVFDKPTPLLTRQMNEFTEFLKTNKEHYPLDNYDKL